MALGKTNRTITKIFAALLILVFAPFAEAAEPGEQAERGVIVVGGQIVIGTSGNGYATIKAVIKNSTKFPVDGLRLDVILFHVERKRAADLAIPFTGGNKAPSLLEPGETGEIVYETNLYPEQISGHRYRLVWSEYNLQKRKKAVNPAPQQEK